MDRTVLHARRTRAAIVAAAAISALGLNVGAGAAPGAPTGLVEPITGRAPVPVSPLEAVTLTESYARLAPPLPAGVASAVSASAAEEPHPEGTSCEAQVGHRHPDVDRNGNGVIDPWEENPHANEDCETIVLWEDGSGALTIEQRTETVTQELSDKYAGIYDREVGRTYTRAAGRELYGSGTHHHGDECNPTQAQWDRGIELLHDTRNFLDKYTNNPVLLRMEGYWPYPVPGTKTFHWFNSGLASPNGTNYYGDTDTETDAETYRAEGQQRVIDPEAQEMFTMALTDDGYVANNVAYVYIYDGAADPFSIDANAPGQRPGTDGDNEGLGCLLYWHGHTEGAEGAATFNTDGRTWMAHLWFYGGLYPFGDADLDGSEPHGWFTPLNNAPALCNHGGGCI